MLTQFSKPEPKLIIKKQIKRIKHIEDAIFECFCGHPDYSHKLSEENCSMCECLAMIFVEIELLVEITPVDIYCFENFDHPSLASPTFWVEFGDWFKTFREGIK